MSHHKGLFVTFEGIDGCGKTTLISSLSNLLARRCEAYLSLKEPGHTILGEVLRKMLLNAPYDITSKAELYLFMAARAQLIEEVIQPALARGTLILCDRFDLSSLVYQGILHALDITFIDQCNRFAIGSCIPDYTFILDLDVSLALERQASTKDRMESAALFHLEEMRNFYLYMPQLYPQRKIVILDATKTSLELANEVADLITRTHSFVFV